MRCGKGSGIAARMHVQGRGTDDKVGALSADRGRSQKVRICHAHAGARDRGSAFGGVAAFADDMPQRQRRTQAPPRRCAPPVKIIDAAPGPARRSRRRRPLPAAPPAVSTQAKTRRRRPHDGHGNRFSFVRVDDGFLRFDLKTGQVAYCNSRKPTAGAARPCRRTARRSSARSASLKDEVAALKRQIEACASRRRRRARRRRSRRPSRAAGAGRHDARRARAMTTSPAPGPCCRTSGSGWSRRSSASRTT